MQHCIFQKQFFRLVDGMNFFLFFIGLNLFFLGCGSLMRNLKKSSFFWHLIQNILFEKHQNSKPFHPIGIDFKTRHPEYHLIWRGFSSKPHCTLSKHSFLLLFSVSCLFWIPCSVWSNFKFPDPDARNIYLVDFTISKVGNTENEIWFLATYCIDWSENQGVAQTNKCLCRLEFQLFLFFPKTLFSTIWYLVRQYRFPWCTEFAYEFFRQKD